jgi:hypothetical protein
MKYLETFESFNESYNKPRESKKRWSINYKRVVNTLF